jgi:sulfur carrier protein
MGKIKVNGKELEIEGPVSVTELIERSKIKKKAMVSVQLNGEFVDRAHFSIVNTNHGDHVFFMYFMSGGSYPHSVRYR